MIFGSNYYNAMDRGYESGGGGEGAAVIDNSYEQPAEEQPQPIVPTGRIGVTVPEGKGQGTFLDTVTAAVRQGVKSVELATEMEGSDRSVGAESYGKEQREALREMARANEVNITSVHAPAQIGNLSGLGEQGFNEHLRSQEIEEVKKAIRFAAEAAQGSAVVVHTGEFPRSISESFWGKEGDQYRFRGFKEEGGKAGEEKIGTFNLVDQHTGQIQTFRKDSPVEIVRGFDSEKGVANVETVTYNQLKEEYEKDPEEYKKRYTRNGHVLSPGEALFDQYYRGQLEGANAQIVRWGGDHREANKELIKLKKALEFYEKLEKTLPESEKYKLLREGGGGAFVPPDVKMPSEWLKQNIERTEENLKFTKEYVESASRQKEQVLRSMNNLKPIEEVGIERSTDSLAQLGKFAMEQTHQNPNVKKDVFIAPEHIFPEMGYGSHPDELINLVKKAREKMANDLVKQGFGREEATKEAKDHIKATLDTQHLGMWRKHFEPMPGETEEQTDKRFGKWYQEEVEKMHKEGIIGNIHAVDGFGYGHTHLPVGEGAMPIKTAVEYLMEHGYEGVINSEGYGEGPVRQITKTWETFGSPIYGVGRPQTWTDVQHSYFGRVHSPYYVFGAYSPSEDWTLWTQVPFE